MVKALWQLSIRPSRPVPPGASTGPQLAPGDYPASDTHRIRTMRVTYHSRPDTTYAQRCSIVVRALLYRKEILSGTAVPR
ncbi:hypothetical protein MMAD_28000 [Mycolicibacterium madagascariense]|uniref:Uncharacterized protein n=1 Tax=Mycolicibacterium madagascariense TaxID=212765 RepID=A0A7I7XHD5_9MYCO|nr:hypothetical protein MMAD_28000 [Mycolicibacterium madagascariense]